MSAASSRAVRDHLRSNVVGYVALFCFAMAGTAGALPGKNTVDGGDIKDGKVTGKDVNEEKLDFKILQRRIGKTCQAGEAIRAVAEDGSVTCQAGMPGPTGPEGPQGPAGPAGPAGVPGGAAGGDLTGSYPDPQIAANAVGTSEVANESIGSSKVINGGVFGIDLGDNTVTGADVNESTLDSSSFVTGWGGSNVAGCDPNLPGGNTEDCITVPVTLPRSARLLAIATGSWFTGRFDDPDVADDTQEADGDCHLFADASNLATQQLGEVKTNAAATEIPWTGVGATGNDARGTLAITQVSGVLAAGAHDVILRCDEDDGDIVFDGLNLSVVMLGTGP